MARKARSSPLEDLFVITQKLPWWVGVALAIVSYLLLHNFASTETAHVTTTRGLGASAASQIFKSLAYFFQFVLPIVFLAAAVASAFSRRKRIALAGSVADGAISVIGEMSWQEFEMLVGEAFRLRGYTVTETGGGGADGGVDLVLTKGAEKSPVQCKQWRALKVGVAIVRELYGVMAARGAAGGFVVSAGGLRLMLSSSLGGGISNWSVGQNWSRCYGAPDRPGLVARMEQPRTTAEPPISSHGRNRPRHRIVPSVGSQWSNERRSRERMLARISGGVRGFQDVGAFAT